MRGTDAADVCTTASTLGSNDVLKNNLNRELKKLGLEDSTGAEGGGTCEAGQYAVVDGTIIEGTVVEGTVVDGTFINGTSLVTSCSDCLSTRVHLQGAHHWEVNHIMSSQLIRNMYSLYLSLSIYIYIYANI